jgi:hypothetical protein
MQSKIVNKYTEEIKKILPHQIYIFLPEFKNTCSKNNLIAFSTDKLTAEDWFNVFKSLILRSINEKKFLPVCKFADGEFIFMNNGLELIDYRLKIKDKIKILIRNTLIRLNLIKFHPFTLNKYSSGKYSYSEIKALNPRYKKSMKFILENGILATSALIGKSPFSERFFKLFSDFVINNKIKITSFNHVPYIFVYALFAGKSKFEILNKKKILIINSFNVEQKKIITNKLISFGAKKILYSNISTNRSAFDVLDIKLEDDIDLILIGAGVGKLFHFEYLSKFNVPCIDIGYIFQTWLDPSFGSARVFCSPDDIYHKEFDQ